MVSGAEAIIRPMVASHWCGSVGDRAAGVIAGEHDSRPGAPYAVGP